MNSLLTRSLTHDQLPFMNFKAVKPPSHSLPPPLFTVYTSFDKIKIKIIKKMCFIKGDEIFCVTQQTQSLYAAILLRENKLIFFYFFFESISYYLWHKECLSSAGRDDRKVFNRTKRNKWDTTTRKSRFFKKSKDNRKLFGWYSRSMKWKKKKKQW